MSEVDDSAATDKQQLIKMDKVLELIWAKNEDLEAHSRRGNIGITGLSESTNTARMEDYVETLLRDLFGNVLSSVFIVESVHRSLGPRLPLGAPAHPIIAKLLNCRDCDAVLRAAREMGEVWHQGNLLSLYPDFTLAVQATRREFLQAKRLHQKQEVQYALLYPAKLKIQRGTQTQIFSDPKAELLLLFNKDAVVIIHFP